MTEEENAKFVKKFKVKKEKKKDSSDILKFLEENREAENETQHLGSHATQTARFRAGGDRDGGTQRERNENYNKALENAREKTLLQKRSAAELEDGDDIDKEIEKQLRLVHKKRTEKVEDVVKDLLDKNTKIEIDFSKPAPRTQPQKSSVPSEASGEKAGKLLAPKGEDREEISEINTSFEFLKTVKTEQEKSESQMKIIAPTPFSIKDTRSGTASIVNISLPSERYIGMSRDRSAIPGYSSVVNKNIQSSSRAKMITSLDDDDTEESKAMNDEGNGEGNRVNGETPYGGGDDENNGEEKDAEKLREEVQFVEEEHVGTGMAGALKLLRERGTLSEDAIEYSGRAKDPKPHEELAKFGIKGEDRVKLEYRDSHGKLMTQKEAFRFMCWKFHGKGPSKRKMEKKRQKELMTNKTRMLDVKELPTMKALRKAQEKTQQAHLVLDISQNQK
eukprot:TRINITY_DN4291_c0_g1_i11.p1 TRINITY_DN4291_c0_g1~~TRINITY_DN4291_c0_g1_i11.p1  ORF type:complete len:448 (+),score=134.16 TRINITY_DN4291_c0_g1_i11:338-1681(+)